MGSPPSCASPRWSRSPPFCSPRQLPRRAPRPGRPEPRPCGPPGNKDGFGTAHATASRVWNTLGRGVLDGGLLPEPRDAGRARPRSSSSATAGRSPTASSTNTPPRALARRRRAASPTARSTPTGGLYRITKTYTTDPARAVVLVHVPLPGADEEARCALYALLRPERCRHNGDDDSRREHAARAADAPTPRRPARSSPRRAFTRDVERLPRHERRLARTCAPTTAWTGATRRRRHGNVVQTGRLSLTGRAAAATATIAIGFAPTGGSGAGTARASLRAATARVARALRGPAGTATSTACSRPQSVARRQAPLRRLR